MARRRPRMDEVELARLKLERAEAVAAAWCARFWELHSGGRLVPSDEDRIKHVALIGPPPPPFEASP